MRFFFHFFLGDQETPDWSGLDLASVDEAIREGAKIAAELGADQELDGAKIVVMDAAGSEVAQFAVAYHAQGNC